MLFGRALVGCGLFASFCQVALALPLQVGSIDFNKPSFLNILPARDPGASELIVTSFEVFGSHNVSRIALTADSLSRVNSLKSQLITGEIKWPNTVTAVPDSVFGANYLAVGGGFLTPGNSTGTVAIVNIYSGEEFAIVKPKEDFFYHKVLWVDMNGDGLLDAVTARAKKPIVGNSEGSWYGWSNPATIRRAHAWSTS